MDNSVGSSEEEIKRESTMKSIDDLDKVKNTFDGIANILNSLSDVDSDVDSSDTEIYSLEEFEVRSFVNHTNELETLKASEKDDKSTKKELTASGDPTDVHELSNENSDNSEVEDEDNSICDVKDDDSLREDSDEENISREKENESSAETKMSSSKNSENNKEKPQMNLGPDFDNVNPFEVIVPLIGKREFPATIDKPFAHRYDLAIEINRRKGIEQMEESKRFLAFKQRQDSRTPEEVELYKRLEKISAMQKAAYLTKIAIRILREITQDEEEFDEDYIIKYFSKFLNISVSYLALIYSPHLVHTLMYIRGCDAFSTRIRNYADECYWKCHALFGIPDGYNFQTVYLSEMKKYGLKEMEHCLKSINLMRDYGDYEPDSPDSEDSAFFELDSNDD